MYRVLIAEDEILVRLGLKNSIDWQKFNMTVIADVSDGQPAWEIYEKEKPELIITDLKMPNMSGMELISRIREKDKETLIIILSCLQEFELIRKAMSLGVSDYILKMTMSEEEMENVLQKAHDELNKHKDTNVGMPLESSGTDVIKENLLKDFLFYNACSINEFETQAVKLKLLIANGRLTLVIMELDHYEQLQLKYNDYKGQKIKISVFNALNDVLRGFKRGEAFFDNDRHYILIFDFNDIPSEQALQQELSGILNKVRSVLSTYLNASVSFGISSVQNGFGALVRMYGEALKALEQKFYLGDGSSISYGHTVPDEKIKSKIDLLRQLPRLPKLLGEQGMQEYAARLDAFQAIHTKGKKQIKDFLIQMLQWFLISLRVKDEKTSDCMISRSQEIQQCETIDEAIDIYGKFISEVSDSYMRNKVVSREISEALDYIKNNYHKDINLQQIATFVGLSSSYLSNLFKKELQVNFIEYLNELRIEKAKELLLDTYLKTYEIAEKVGFTETTYFSKVFKKLTGSSPVEFRKQWMREWSEDMDNEDS